MPNYQPPPSERMAREIADAQREFAMSAKPAGLPYKEPASPMAMMLKEGSRLLENMHEVLQDTEEVLGMLVGQQPEPALGNTAPDRPLTGSGVLSDLERILYRAEALSEEQHANLLRIRALLQP